MNYSVTVRFIGLNGFTEPLGSFDSYQEALSVVQQFIKWNTLHRVGQKFTTQQMNDMVFQVLCEDNRQPRVQYPYGASHAGLYCIVTIHMEFDSIKLEPEYAAIRV